MITTKHIFRGGLTRSSTGKEINYTPEMLQDIVDSFNPETHEPPVVFGHSNDNRFHFSQPLDGKPAGGWIKRVYREGLDLYADIETTPLGEQAIRDKLYRKVSASFYSPDMPSNPSPGKWGLRHVALLGADPPAIKGLKDFVYEEASGKEEELTFLLDEDFAPTTIEELSPIEKLKDTYEKYIKDKHLLEKHQEQQSIEQQQGTDGSQGESSDAQDVNANTVNSGETMANADQDYKEMGKDKEDVKEDYSETLESTEPTSETDTEFMEKKKSDCKDKEYMDKKAKKKKGEYEDDMDYMDKKAKKMKGEYEDDDDDEDEKEDMEYKDPVSNDRKIKKPSKKVMLEDLDETGEGDSDIEEDKKSTGETDQKSIDKNIKETGTSTVVEGRDQEDVGDDDGDQEMDRKKAGKGKKHDVEEYTEPVEIEGDIFDYADDEFAEGKGCPEGEKMVFGVCRKLDGSKSDKEKNLEERAKKGGSNLQSNKPVIIDGVKYGWAKKNGKPMLVKWGSVAGEKTSKKPPRAKDDPSKDKDDPSKDKKGKDYTENPSEENNLMGNNDYAELTSKLEALQAQLDQEKATRQKLERENKVRDFADFAEGLYRKGSLTDALVPQTELVELLTKLEYNEVEYSEDSSPATVVMSLLEKLPPMVDFNDYSEDDLVTPDKPEYGEGTPDQHLQQALSLSEEKGLEFTEALKSVMYPNIYK